MSQTKQRSWTKQIFKHLEANGFHPVDVQYGNGCFVFKHGSDMVVHFYVKELKGWKFGIWWNLDGEKTFDFFTQYERDIDKFKPSASMLVREDVVLDDWHLEDFVEMCRFIKKHPYRAWALDQSYRCDVWEWGTLDGCFKEYWKMWWVDSVCYPRVHKKLTKEYLKIVRLITNVRLVNPKIIDENKRDWSCSPRFYVVCDDAMGEELKPGHYIINFKEELEDWLLKKIKRYNKKFAKHKKRFGQIYDVRLGDFLEFTVKKKEKKNDAK